MTGQLNPAIVLSTTEDECVVVVEGRRTVVPYVSGFPRPRTDRVAPGHLVALLVAVDGSLAVVWRWFDAVVVNVEDGLVTMWEPGHRTVSARPRAPLRVYIPGSRAYLSAGLPGADWWVAGPVVDRAEDADVELDEVSQFLRMSRPS